MLKPFMKTIPFPHPCISRNVSAACSTSNLNLIINGPFTADRFGVQFFSLDRKLNNSLFVVVTGLK